MMITKSTTPDLIKMAARCDEYYRQQIKSSKRVFGADSRQDPSVGSHSDGESMCLYELCDIFVIELVSRVRCLCDCISKMSVLLVE